MKDELAGKTVKVEVFSRVFRPTDREESLEWTVAGQTISAGIVPNYAACIEDIVESFREANPKHIEIRFPAVKASRKKTDFSRRKQVAKLDRLRFRNALYGYTVISIAE
ncbi:MAG: hypothetical protein Q7R75_00985 [bacterium]|nr:hypothetical protein [bacterium]